MNENLLKIPRMAWIKDKRPDLVVLNSKFFLSPKGCCAQTALPFWGKLVGVIKNQRDIEAITRVTVSLLDDDGNILDRETDTFIVDGMDETTFEVTFKRYNERITRYSIELTEMDEETFAQSFL